MILKTGLRCNLDIGTLFEEDVRKLAAEEMDCPNETSTDAMTIIVKIL